MSGHGAVMAVLSSIMQPQAELTSMEDFCPVSYQCRGCGFLMCWKVQTGPSCAVLMQRVTVSFQKMVSANHKG